MVRWRLAQEGKAPKNSLVGFREWSQGTGSSSKDGGKNRKGKVSSWKGGKGPFGDGVTLHRRSGGCDPALQSKELIPQVGCHV